MPAKNHQISLSPLKIAVIYLIVAGIWIAFTDSLLESLVSNAQALSILQTFKGWFYVLVTGAGLYWLIKKHDQQLQKKEVRLENLQGEVQSEKELKDVLFEKIPILITIYDPDLEEFEVNKEFEKVTGWTNEEITEKNIDLLKAVYPDLETRKQAVEFMNNPGVGWKEFPLTKRDGDKIPTSWTDIRLTDNTSVGIGIDMTDIKASQAKVRESRELLKKVFESLESSVIILDYESRTIVDCNKSTEKLFGYSKEELEGSSTRMLHVSEEKFETFNEIGKDTLAEKGVFQTEYKMQKKDGTIFHSDHTVSLVYDEEGEIDKVVSVVRDITDQKEYEQKLQKQQERLLRSQRIGEIGDWEFDLKTEDITWSPTMYTIYEYDPELDPPSFENLMKHYHETSSDNFKQIVQQAIENKESYDVDTEIKTGKGNKKYIRAIGIPIENDKQEVTKLLGIAQDISERKKYEQALTLQNKKLERAQKMARIGYWEYNLEKEGNPIWSDNLKRIYGLPQDYKPTVESFLSMIPPEDQPDFDEFVKKVVKEKVVNDMFHLTKPNGEEGFYHSRNELIKNNKGEPEKILGIVHEITDLKQAEQELAKEKQRFQLVAQTTSDVIWDLDLTDNTIWWSKGFEEHFGYDRNKAARDLSSWSDHIHSDDRARVTASLEEAINGNEQFWQEQYRYQLADGSSAHIIDRGIIIRDKHGEAVRMVGTLNNITDRVEAEQQLKKSEEKYRYLFENNPQPMWIFDTETLEFVEVNKAAINHYGYSEEEFMDMTLLDIRPEKDAEDVKENVKQNKGTTSYSEDWVHLKKDGTKIDVELSASDVNYKKDKTYRLVLINDVTEQKRLQEKVIQSVIEGEDRERKRIAHELHDGLGQHLVAASMNLQSAKADIEKLSDKRQKQFETGISLLKNALSETRSIAHNLMPKAISDYGLIAALENLINDFDKSTDIDFEFTHNYNQLKLTDQAEINIYRIFQEIITNAVRHSECTKIDIGLQLKEDSLTMKVIDDGIGAQLDTEDEQAGLGLRSIKTRVSSLNGSLDINSEPGTGMETVITIPEINKLKSNTSDHG
ncbi:MAG: PAS domain S-box protein [Aliifodinibius sp.]|nr:PAS domain S-box protein [Fodinibius sp.]NIV13099.1 PAS domain S-box protein [Fodinibius sp.]NIY26764.1 PAS domain S-box protein [Fodinibius sp.]